MRCKTCGNDAVKSQANWQEFYYCRTCKIEVEETSSLKKDIELLYNLLVVKKEKLTPETEKLLYATMFNSDSMKEDKETHQKLIDAMDVADAQKFFGASPKTYLGGANSDADDYDLS